MPPAGDHRSVGQVEGVRGNDGAIVCFIAHMNGNDVGRGRGEGQTLWRHVGGQR